MAKNARKTSALHDMEYLKKLAIAGAEATLNRLREEIHIIERTFPELSSAKLRGDMLTTIQKRTRTMTAAGRKEVSLRMKKYWAERRKAAAQAKK